MDIDHRYGDAIMESVIHRAEDRYNLIDFARKMPLLPVGTDTIRNNAENVLRRVYQQKCRDTLNVSTLLPTKKPHRRPNQGTSAKTHYINEKPQLS